MAQIQKTIERLGYTPNEAKVYIAALSMGECHASDLANKLKMPLSSVQAVIDKLHDSGLMNFYIKNRYKYWIAESPEKLLVQLRQREEAIVAALPALSALRKQTSAKVHKPTVKVFTGREEIKGIFDDILDTKRPILSIIPEDAFLRLFYDSSILEDFIRSRIERFLPIRSLVPNTPAGKELTKNASKELREVRFLPERMGIQTAIFIYGDKVANIIFNEKQPTAVLIEDPSIRETKTAVFEELWNLSSAQSSTDAPQGVKEVIQQMLEDTH